VSLGRIAVIAEGPKVLIETLICCRSTERRCCIDGNGRKTDTDGLPEYRHSQRCHVPAEPAAPTEIGTVQTIYPAKKHISWTFGIPNTCSKTTVFPRNKSYFPPTPATTTLPPLQHNHPPPPRRPHPSQTGPRTPRNLRRQRQLPPHLRSRRRRQPARHSASQRPRNGRRMRWKLRLQYVPYNRGGR